MKKLLGIVILSLLLSGNAYSQTFFFEKCHEPTGPNLSEATINISNNTISYKMATKSDGKIYFDGDTNISQINDLDIGVYNSEKVEKITSRDTKWLEILSRHQVLKIKKKYIKNYAYSRIEFTFYPELKKITTKMSMLAPGSKRAKKKLEKYWSNSLPWKRSITATCEKVTYTKKDKVDKTNQAVLASSGTAFFIDNNGHMITNHHVIEGCKDKSQISYNDKNIKAKLIAKDEFLDLALLKADVKNSNFINISTAPPKKLKRVIVAGYPFGLELSNDLKFNSGIITSLKGLGDDSTRIQIDAAINPGNSGGPIVYENNGELAAVAVAGLSKDKTEAVNFGIKASSVKNFLQSNQIDLTLVKQKFDFSNDDLVELLENSTLYTFCK